MASSCAVFESSAASYMNAGWDQAVNYSTQMFNAANGFLAELSALDVTPVNLNLPFDVEGVRSTPFSPPSRPDDPALAYNQSNIRDPGDITIGTISLSGFPSFNADDFAPDSLQITYPDRPDNVTESAPTETAVLTDITLPTMASYTLPTVPVAREITLPDDITSAIPSFTSTAPSTAVAEPTDTFLYSEDEYSSTLLTAATDQLAAMVSGTNALGLSAAIWGQVWDRATEREERTASQVIEEAQDTHAARGFSLPSGALAKQIQVAQLAALSAKNSLGREQAIKEADLEVAQLRFALTTTVQLEGQLINLFITVRQRALAAAEKTFDAGIRIFEAKVAKINLALQAYRVDAQVFAEVVRGELAKAEAHKVNLEGKKITGDLNQQDVDRYTAQLTGIETLAKIFESELKGTATQLEVDKNAIEIDRLRVQRFGELWRAKAIEFEAYKTEIEGERTKSDIQKNQVDALGERVRAYAAETGAVSTQKQIELATNDQILRKFLANLERYKSDLAGESDRISSGVQIYEGQSRLYATDGSIEEARVRADGQGYQLSIEKGRAEALLRVEEAKLAIEQTFRATTLEQDTLKTQLGATAQIGSAALNSVSVSSSISDRASRSTGCTTSFTFDQTEA